MIKDIEKLCELYNINKNLNCFNSDISDVLEFDEVEHENYLISISMNKIDELYYIFLFIEKDGKLIFKGKIKEDCTILDIDYLKLKEDLDTLELIELIEKYKNMKKSKKGIDLIKTKWYIINALEKTSRNDL